jgi:hypothetical protein
MPSNSCTSVLPLLVDIWPCERTEAIERAMLGFSATIRTLRRLAIEEDVRIGSKLKAQAASNELFSRRRKLESA